MSNVINILFKSNTNKYFIYVCQKQMTLKQLSQIRFDNSKKDHPNIPEFAIPRKAYSDKDANSLTAAIVDCITFSGGWATRISTEGRYIEKLEMRIHSSVKTGTADIHACYKGLHLSIEVKMKGDRLSEAQREVQKNITNAGGRYIVAYSWDSFTQIFEKI